MAIGVKSRIQSVRDRVSRACEAVARDPEEVTLVAVTKTVSAAAVLEAHQACARHFGESRWQEAQTKVHTLPEDAAWHYIGRLQSNKALLVGGTFDVIHTLENDRQLEQLDRLDRVVDVMVQVNIAQESQKGCVFLETLDEYVDHVSKHHQVRFRGLMTIGQAGTSPEETRQAFRALAEANRRVGGVWLSMGMSHDLEVAVQEGSTHIRVGTAIFGDRA